MSGEWFERVWGYREETLYPRLFGTASAGGIHVLTYELFKERFEETKVDPRWFFHGVLKFPPLHPGTSWRYVTSGLSNAWEDDEPHPDGWSGLGIELVLETPQDCAWAVNLTAHMLAYQVLLAAGRFGEARIIEPYARIPLNSSIDGAGSELTHLLVCRSPIAPDDLELDSGRFSLFQLVGVTASEIEFARRHGGDELLAKLAEHGAYPVTDAQRTSVVLS